jgi:hypothetical protein
MIEQELINLGFKHILPNYKIEDILVYILPINNSIVRVSRYYSRLTTISIDAEIVFEKIIISDWIEEIKPILINKIRSLKIKTILND